MNQNVTEAPSQGWGRTASLADEFRRNAFNPRVGMALVHENERVRVWSLQLAPGERIGFHRHVLDYFWTVVMPGRACSRRADGTVVELEYAVGDTTYERFAAGEFKIHDLENIGSTVLGFTTVEFLDSANPPLPLPHESATAQTSDRTAP